MALRPFLFDFAAAPVTCKMQFGIMLHNILVDVNIYTNIDASI